MVQQPSYWKVFTRRKELPAEGAEGDSKLNRVMGLYDLTALGVGSTLGAGVYVLAGQIARDQAGPSVMLSFAIAALASLLAGICYAEFGARVPKAGSAYIYSYVCIGEFVAFVIGWNLILEYVIGTASVCRGISLYLDTLINDTLKNTFAEVAPMHVSFLGSYFDFFAFGLVVVFGVALAFGVETSTMANNFCTCLNISVLLFVVIAGAIKADFANWSVDVSTVNVTDTSHLGAGGFFPFGFAGTLKGAATCFFGFVGFDCIATTGEEVRNPRRNIPRSILFSLLIIFLCYFGVSTVLTLMVPYYLQDPNAPLPYAFKAVGWTFAMWIVSVGGLLGLMASLCGALFPLPRIMYSMAEDGLLFRFLGKISLRYRVPVVGSIFAAILTALIAGLFDLDQLVNLLSIGTLLAYSVVAISVTLLRYMDNSTETISDRENGSQLLTENSLLTSAGSRVTFQSVMVQLFNCRRVQTPNVLSTRVVGSMITLFCLLSLAIGLIFMQAHDALIHNQLWVLVLLGVLVALTLLVLLGICLQPREAYTRIFRVPLVPLVPAISIFINIYLMLQLDVMTWIRFGIWMIIGIPMFIACWCVYDIKNLEKRNPKRLEYERLLKESGGSNINQPYTNGHSKIETIESNGAAHTAINGNLSSARNEHSVKSLDEIMNMNEVSEDLIELKHANGKIFYVEDNRSSASTTTLERNEERKLGSAADISEEDEKSVMAMLDDVLQAADDSALPTPSIIPDYSRKFSMFSVDSEMLPSVIESTTVATVHSSSDSSENGVEDVLELEHEQWLTNFNSDRLQALAASELAARELVDELLNSEQLWRVVDERKALRDLAENEEKAEKAEEAEEAETAVMQLTSPVMGEKFQRSASNASMLSTNSAIEDALHSQKFKNKLSQLMMQPPVAPTTNKPTKEAKNTLESNVRSSAEANRANAQAQAQLQQSESETDVPKLVLQAIEGSGSNLDEPAETVADGIPKPPKFDPILYQTINSLSLNRQRPGLDKLLAKDKESPPKNKIEETDTETEAQAETAVQLPFKLKLEAILQRGPSHRTQQRPEVSARRPKSMGATFVDAENHFVNVQDDGKRLTTKSDLNLSTIVDEPVESTDPAHVIKNARKSLKHVKGAAVEL